MSYNLIRRVLTKLDKNYLPYESFGKLEFFKKVNIFKGVNIVRLPTKKGMYFLSTLETGTKITEHYHNSVEYFYITKGKILVNDSIELGEGDEIEFQPFELHRITVIEECEMYVQLIKNVRKLK